MSLIFFEGTAPTHDIYVDDVRVIPPTSNLVTDGGFEGGFGGLEFVERRIAGNKQCTVAHRRAEPAFDEP